jgi:hypothetical protein
LTQCNNPQQKENTSENKEIKKDSCCVKENIISSNKKSTESEITCPECKFKKTETMPTDVCLIKYTCDNCYAVLYSKDGDCCVFCSYGSHKCPSKQED